MTPQTVLNSQQQTSSLLLRPATASDVPALQQLIEASARGLNVGDYSEQQVEAALRGAMGVDTQLIRDGTYFVVETRDGQLVGCGGWSKRGTYFGADAGPDRDLSILDPSRDAARIRAFFVHPAWARRGIGRRLLEHCEDEAYARGFRATSLMATLTGQKLYRTCGYVADVTLQFDLGNGISGELVPMGKSLA